MKQGRTNWEQYIKFNATSAIYNEKKVTISSNNDENKDRGKGINKGSKAMGSLNRMLRRTTKIRLYS